MISITEFYEKYVVIKQPDGTTTKPIVRKLDKDLLFKMEKGVHLVAGRKRSRL